MSKQTQSIAKYAPYIVGYACFVLIPVGGITAVVLLGRRFTSYIYNHITRLSIWVDVIGLVMLIAIFFICFYAVIIVLNLLRK